VLINVTKKERLGQILTKRDAAAEAKYTRIVTATGQPYQVNRPALAQLGAGARKGWPTSCRWRSACAYERRSEVFR
jgi:hypothetical protein